MQSRSETRISAWVSLRLESTVPLPHRVDNKQDLLSELPLHLKPRRWGERATKTEIAALLSMSDSAIPLQRCFRAYTQRRWEKEEEERIQKEERLRKYDERQRQKHRWKHICPYCKCLSCQCNA